MNAIRDLIDQWNAEAQVCESQIKAACLPSQRPTATLGSFGRRRLFLWW